MYLLRMSRFGFLDLPMTGILGNSIIHCYRGVCFPTECYNS